MKRAHARPRCNSCGATVQGKPLYYRVRTQITSEPNELSFTDEDLRRDPCAEMERLCRRLEGRDPQELEDEVYVLLDYYLCAACKEAFVKKVRKTR